MKYKIYIQIQDRERVEVDAGTVRSAAVYDFQQRVIGTMLRFGREATPYRNQIRYIDYWLSEIQPDNISGKDFEFIMMQVRVKGRVIL